MRISICIPSRGRVDLLWATICACEYGLSGIDHEYIVYINGKELDEPHMLLKQNSGVRLLVNLTSAVPPPIARNRCAEVANGDWLVFFDDHCLPDPDWFTKLIELDKDIVHSSYSTHVGYHRYYHSFPLPGGRNPLIRDYSRVPVSTMPYKCVSAPHGGFAVKRQAWEAIGGYGDFWQGFGGEEAYFDLLAAQKGFEVWMHPQMHFYHFSCKAETRGYDKWAEANDANFDEAWKRLNGS